jgi:hypothetical protein
VSALTKCLHEQGVDAAPIKPGEVPTPPAGVTVKKFHEALLHCGVPAVGAPVTPANRVPLFQGRYTGHHLRVALDAFEQCLRDHGVAIPHTDTAGGKEKVPVFPPESAANEQKLIEAEDVCFPLIEKQLDLKVKPPFNPGGPKSSKDSGA